MKNYYCDNCGESSTTGEMYHYGQLPLNIASANLGESGSICRECFNLFGDKTHIGGN